MKFIRRTDLDSVTRAEIALEGFLYGRTIWGYITDLAERHNVSRTFVYQLINDLKFYFSVRKTRDSFQEKMEYKLFGERLAVSTRLHGGCSIGDISLILKSLELSGDSVGTVSSFLKNAAIAIPYELPQIYEPIVIIADEIFACKKPILVIIDARSHYILVAELANDRNADTWKKCFDYLKENGVNINYVVKDQARNLHRGVRDCGLIEHADLYHLMKPFDPFLGSLERKAYAAIKYADSRLKVFESRQSDKAREKKLKEYETAVEKTSTAVKDYDNYDFLHKELHEAFNSFNPDGSIRTRIVVEDDVKAILELMEEEFSDCQGIMKAVKFLKNNIDFYWGYFERLEKIIISYEKIIPEDILKELCLSWQKDKKSRAVKSAKHKKTLEKQSQEHYKLALYAETDDLKKIAEQLFDKLEYNVRSSSPLEAINSSLRDFLNSCRGQITQETLNMIVYFLNHKIAARGRYKNTSAWQRLTGKPENMDVIKQILQFYYLKSKKIKRNYDYLNDYLNDSRELNLPVSLLKAS